MRGKMVACADIVLVGQLMVSQAAHTVAISIAGTVGFCICSCTLAGRFWSSDDAMTLGNLNQPIGVGLWVAGPAGRVRSFSSTMPTVEKQWSWRFSPTFGRSYTSGMLCLFSSSAGPTPESFKIWGVFSAPPERTTSFRATYRRSSTHSIPCARLLSKVTRATGQSTTISRFGGG